VCLKTFSAKAWRVAGEVPFGLDFREDLGIVGRVANHRDEAVILGRRAQHGRSADIDVLDGILELDVGLGDRFPEGVQVHSHHVDGLDGVGLHLRAVFLAVAHAQKSSVDLRMQGLHPAVEDFRRARVVRNGDRRDPLVRQELQRASGAQDPESRGMQPLGEFQQSGLVGYAEEGRFPLVRTSLATIGTGHSKSFPVRSL
jgi:hypothetical protein